MAISQHDVPKETIEQIRTAAEVEAQAAGKPPEIQAKIADGRVRKFLEENTLLDQKYIRDDTKTVKAILPADVTIKRFVRYTVGAE